MLFVILTMLISSPTPTIISTKRSHVWLGKGKKARAKRQKFGRDALIKTAGGQEAKAGLSHDIVIFRGEGYVRFNVAEWCSCRQVRGTTQCKASHSTSPNERGLLEKERRFLPLFTRLIAGSAAGHGSV